MKVVVQRVKKASVTVDNKLISKIDKGFLVLVGFTHNDGMDNIKYIVKKLKNLRIFDDDTGNMNLNINDIGGSILSVSQFTLYADTKNGNRPSFVDSMKYDEAEKLYSLFNEELKSTNMPISTGIFGADMKVSLLNDGPITIIIER